MTGKNRTFIRNASLHLAWLIRWNSACIGLIAAVCIRDPYVLPFRPFAERMLAAWGVIGIGLFWRYWRTRATSLCRQRVDCFFWGVVFVITMFILAKNEVGFWMHKHCVLRTDPYHLQLIGQHCIAGYMQADDLVPLIRTGGIGGVYVTQRNVKNRTFQDVQAEIAMFQNVRRAAGLPPLLIMGDQEGGIVSHLSPPLKRLPSLATLIDESFMPDSIPESVIRAYADVHAQGLKALGVNVNLSPVVDLKVEPSRAFRDRHSRIRERAISDDPVQVAQVALWYSQQLQQSGVIPTLKHFPGLGHATGDTHHVNVNLNIGIAELHDRDWVPFRYVLPQSQAFLMIGHVVLPELDDEYPASCSKRVIQTIIRDQWQHDGVLITDDFSMRPIYRRPGGVGASAVAALNAGVDLILVSYDGEQVYDILHALLQASARQTLDREMLACSQSRLKRALQDFHVPVVAANLL